MGKEKAKEKDKKPATGYKVPKVWKWKPRKNDPFGGMNRPISGATHETTLPRGKHPFQLYSLGSPNGQKVTIMFEELLAAGHAGAEYDAWMINIMDRDQFGSGFVSINPNSKIPALARPVGQEAGAGVRERGDPAAPRREVRRLPARAGFAPAGRVLFLADVADGDRAVAGRRLRPLLPHGAREARVCDQPLFHGSQAHSRRRRPAPGGQSLFLRQANSPSPTSPTSAGSITSSPATPMAARSSSTPRAIRTSPAGSAKSASARACGAGWWSIAAAARGTLRSGTRRRISTR